MVVRDMVIRNVYSYQISGLFALVLLVLALYYWWQGTKVEGTLFSYIREVSKF